MELIIIRNYHTGGTNGSLYIEDDPMVICHTIELPWRGNRANLSCIPEGRYPIKMRFTQKRQWHLVVKDVKDRSLILVHPANNALLELEGCIAPVTRLTGEGRGAESRTAFEKLKDLVSAALENEPVFLTIKST